MVLSVLLTSLLAASKVTSVPTKDHSMTKGVNNTCLKLAAAESDNPFSTPVNGSIPSNTSCPTWTYPTENGSCECGDTLNGAIQCNISSHHLAVHSCYCMTYDNFTGNTVAGPCSPTCTYMLKPSHIYRNVPHSVHQLNTKMCGYLHRTGQLCGQCEEGYKQPAYFYSDSNKCVTCDDTKYNWLKYIIAAFAPLTFFLFVVFCFRISATSAQLNAFILFSQIISAPTSTQSISKANALHGCYKIWAQIASTLYGIWNLDFFRTLFPGICLDVSSLQILMLEYAIASYPLLLMIIFYVLIELHDSNCRPIVYMWKPFNRCLSRFRRQWNARASTIDAFATFLLLSYSKLLWVSIDVLFPTWVYDVQGKRVGLYLYYNTTVKYFGREHLPYAIITLAVLFIFILFPTALLFLYPMKCFQRCLNRSQMKLRTLHTFTDAFQGCYKDGTNGTRDCRYFSAMYLMLRITGSILFISTTSAMSLLWIVILCLLLLTSIAICQPYKSKHSIYISIDIALILLLAVWLLSIVGIALTNFTANINFLEKKDTLLGLSFLTSLLPLVYFFFLMLRWLWRCITLRCESSSRRFSQRRASQDSLPDRMVNPDHYSLYGLVGT